MNHQTRTFLLDYGQNKLPVRSQLDRFKAIIEAAARTPDVIVVREYSQWFSELKGFFSLVSAFAAVYGVDIPPYTHD